MCYRQLIMNQFMAKRITVKFVVGGRVWLCCNDRDREKICFPNWRKVCTMKRNMIYDEGSYFIRAYHIVEPRKFWL